MFWRGGPANIWGSCRTFYFAPDDGTDKTLTANKTLYFFEKLEPRILLSADLLPLAPDVEADGAVDNTALHISVAEETQPTQLSEDTSTIPSVTPPIVENSSVTTTTEVTAAGDESPQSEAANTQEETEEAEEGEDDSGVLEPSTSTTATDDPAVEDELAASPVVDSDITEQDSPSELIFINNDIEASDPLIADALRQNDRAEVIFLDGASDGIQQITDTLAEYDSVDALHFLSHGTSGNVKLGNSWLNSDNIDTHADSISSWGDSLSESGDILFYGCDLTSDQAGMDLVEEISDLTGADVAASDDTTGHELLGGDWVLEYQTGDIEADSPFSSELQEGWVHILAEENIADNFNTGLYNNNSGTLPWSSDWVEIGETTDPSTGNVRIDTDGLYIYTADGFQATRGISRVVDLSSSASAYLSFDYEVLPSEYFGHVSLQISPEGDPGWHVIGDYWTDWTRNDSELIDISGYSSAATEIRFISSYDWLEGGDSWGNDEFFVDNLRIDYTTSTWSTPLWLSTDNNVNNGDQQGTDTWKKSDIIGVGNPDLTFDPGTSSGNFSIAAQISSFADGKNINSLHYVSRDIQIGSSNHQLLAGDVLFASKDANATGFGGLDPQKSDIFYFRPVTEGDYSAGTFQLLFDDLTGGKELRGITLIEKDVTVGGKDMQAGDLLFLRDGGEEEKNIWLYETDDVAPGSGTSGTISVLLDGEDTGVDIRERLTGIDLVEESISVGGRTLNSGAILLSVDHTDTIGSTTVEKFDIFAFEVSSVSDPTGITDIGVATASLFFDGSDVSFDTNNEKLNGFSLTVSPEQVENTITGGTFDAENESITLTGTDFSFIGNVGENVKAQMDWSKFVWDINGDDDVTANITFISNDFSTVEVTNNTTLTLNLTDSKTNEIVATAGYAGSGGIDTLDITAGFSSNGSGELSTTDSLADGPLTTITAPSDILLSANTINENIDTTGGVTIGTLSALDADFGDSATFTIDGGTDSSLFSIGGPGANELVLNDGLLDHERQDSYQLAVRVTDSSGLFHIKILDITVNDINEAPVIGTNNLTLEEGETVVLSNSQLAASDVDNNDSTLSFSVSAVTGGRFEHISAPGVAISNFLQSDIVSGNIRFIHDGGENAPNYTVTVTDGTLSTGPDAPTITFTQKNDDPVFINNELTITEGTTVVLTGSDLLVTDLDNNDANLTFTASNVVGGHFELIAAPGTVISSFTQLQIGNGEVQFVHDGGETSPAYDLRVSDGTDSVGPDTGGISYTPVNDAPTLQNNVMTLAQGDTIVLSGSHLQALDPDDNPADLTFTVSGVTAGRFELVSSPGFAITGFTQLQVNNSEIQFVHNGTGTPPSYFVEIFDDELQSDGPEAVTINFTPVNQAPVLQNNSLAINEGGTVVLSGTDLSATDPDNSDATLIFTVSGVTGGQFELLTNPSVAITSFNQVDITGGQILFIHDGSEAAPAYNIAVTDSALTDGPAAANITFTNQNDAPILGNNNLNIDEGGTLVFDSAHISATDVESVDSDLIFSVTGVAGGIFTTVADPATAITSFTQAQVMASEIQFIHDGNETAPAYSITVSDGSLADGPEAAGIVFTNQNDTPILGNNSLAISEGGAVTLSATNLSASDTDNIDGNLLFTVSNISGGQFERLSAPGIAITSFTQSEILSGDVQFIHNGDETGPAYRITVSDTALSAGPADATITFTNANDAPVLVNNGLTISEGGSVILSSADVSAIDIDDSDPSLIFVVSGITGGQFELISNPSVPITSFTQGDVTGGQVRFVHDGDEAAPTYSVMVLDGALVDGPQAATIVFTNQNDGVTATNLNIIESYSEDTAKNLADIVISDVDGGTGYSATLTLSEVTAGSFNTGSVGTASATFASGVLTVSGTDISDVNTLLSSVFFTPSPNYNSNFTIDISVTDGIAAPLTGTRSMSAIAVNDAPVLSSNSLTIDEGGTVNISAAELAATDIDNIDGDLIFTISGITGGQFENIAAPGTPITSFTQAQIAAAQIQFIHDGNENAPAYSVTVSDGALTDGPQATTISFTNQNDAPVLGSNSLTIDEGGTVNISAAELAATDIDNIDGDLVFTISGITGGQFENIAAPGTPITSFTQAQIAAAQIQFIHDGNENAPAYSVTVSDGALTDGPQATTISFTNQNDAPVLGSNSLTIDEGGTVNISAAELAATDIDNIDGDLIFTISGITGGQFENIAAPGTPITSFTQAQIAAAQIQFIHDGNENAPAYSVTVSDGALADGPQATTINFTNQNDAPVLGSNSLTIDEGGTVNISAAELAATDIDNIDGDLIFTISGITGGQFENIAAPGTPITSFTQAQMAAAQIQFIHDGNENAPAYSVTVSDGALADGPQATTINFTNQNDAPVLGSNSLTIDEGGTVNISAAELAATDIDNIDGNLVFTISGITGGQFENIAAPGTPITSFTQAQIAAAQIQFIHDGNENAPAYSVTVSDGALTDGPQATTISFTNQNDAPTATTLNITESYTEDAPKNLTDIVISDSDGGEIVTATLTLVDPSFGSLSTSGGAVYNSVSGTWHITDTVTNINPALAGVTFIPSANISQDTYIDIDIRDGLENGVGALTGRIDLPAISVGDTPLVESVSTLPSTQSGLIFINPNALDGPEVTHFQIVNITNGRLYHQDGVTEITNDEFITVSQGTAGVRFTPLSDTDGSFGVLSSEDGATAAPQSAIAISTVSTTVPASPPVTVEAPPADTTEISLPDNSEEIEPGENSAEVVTTTPDAIIPPIEEPYNPIAEMVAGLPPSHENSPVPEKSEPPDASEPASEDTENKEPETVLTINAEYIQERSQADSFDAAVDPNSPEPVTIDLSFRDLSTSGFAAGFNQNDRTGFSLSATSENDSSLFTVEDYDLLNLDYRQRTALDYENLKKSLDSFREETKNEASLGRTAVGSAIAASTGLSAGYVVWMLRSGALLSSILSSLPAWQLADPLAILVGQRNEEDENEEESIESILKANSDDKKSPEKDEKPEA